MIILDAEPSSDSKSALSALDLSSGHLDPPPVYLSAARPLLHSRSHSALGGSRDKPLPLIPPPPHRISSNNLEVVRSETLKGTWVVDTSLPASARRSASTDSTSFTTVPKPNLRLVSHQGGIDASITLKGSTRGIIEAASHNGTVSVRVQTESNTPFRLQVFVQNGDTQIYLPHSFYGPIRRRSPLNKLPNGTHGEPPRTPVFSPTMHPHLVALSSEDDSSGEFETISFFLGDLSIDSTSQSGEPWSADEVVVELESKAHAYFFWCDEIHETVLPSAGFLTKMKPWMGMGRRRNSEA